MSQLTEAERVRLAAELRAARAELREQRDTIAAYLDLCDRFDVAPFPAAMPSEPTP